MLMLKLMISAAFFWTLMCQDNRQLSGEIGFFGRQIVWGVHTLVHSSEQQELEAFIFIDGKNETSRFVNILGGSILRRCVNVVSSHDRLFFIFEEVTVGNLPSRIVVLDQDMDVLAILNGMKFPDVVRLEKGFLVIEGSNTLRTPNDTEIRIDTKTFEVTEEGG